MKLDKEIEESKSKDEQSKNVQNHEKIIIKKD